MQRGEERLMDASKEETTFVGVAVMGPRGTKLSPWPHAQQRLRFVYRAGRL
jgi:hypothetical protein